MSLYGDLATAKAFLRAQSTSVLDPDADIRLADIQIAVSAALEAKTGRTFGDGPSADETVLIWAAASDVLLLPKPARSITSVTVGGTVEGGTFSGGQLLDASQWVHWFVDGDGLIHAMRRGAGWWGAVQVVADFVDNDDDAEVPADVTAAATFLIAETYKVREASPAGFVGPDGATVPIRNPWNDPTVQAVIRTYAVEPAIRLVV